MTMATSYCISIRRCNVCCMLHNCLHPSVAPFHVSSIAEPCHPSRVKTFYSIEYGIYDRTVLYCFYERILSPVASTRGDA